MGVFAIHDVLLLVPWLLGPKPSYHCVKHPDLTHKSSTSIALHSLTVSGVLLADVPSMCTAVLSCCKGLLLLRQATAVLELLE